MTGAKPRPISTPPTGLQCALGTPPQLKPSKTILDLGSGYGGQLRFWHDTFDIGAIDTVEPDNTAREYAQKFNHKSPIPIQWLPSIGEAKSSYDAVLSLDAAYHFPDRRALFTRCFDLLKPKGRLAITDLILTAPSKPGGRLLKRLSGIFDIPSANLKSREVYQQELEELGFDDVSFQDISKEVLVGFSENWRAALAAHRGRPDAFIPEIPIDRERSFARLSKEPHSLRSYSRDETLSSLLGLHVDHLGHLRLRWLAEIKGVLNVHGSGPGDRRKKPGLHRILNTLRERGIG